MGSCLSAIFTPKGGISASVDSASESVVWIDRYGDMEASAWCVSIGVANIERVGGMGASFSLVCPVGKRRVGYLRTLESYVLTINGGYNVLPIMN